MEETSLELEDLLGEEELKMVPVLVYANKQDMNSALSSEEVATSLQLNTIQDVRINTGLFEKHIFGYFKIISTTRGEYSLGNRGSI